MKNFECSRFKFVSLLLVFLLAATVAFTGCSNPDKAKAEHLRRGEAFLAEKKYQEASIEFRNAIQIDNSLAAAHWGLAQAYEGLQRFAEAIEELKITIQLDPNNLDARVKLGTYFLAGKNLGEAERLAQDVLEKNPNHIEGHILMANVFLARGENDKALAELNRAIQLDSSRVESYLSLARFYIQTRDLIKAEETFKRAISVNEKSAVAHIEYGKFLAQNNRTQEAENEFLRAVQVEPENRDARFVLASFYLVNEQIDKAEAAYKTLSELDSDKAEGRAVLADFYSAVGRLQDAANIYREIVANYPDFARGQYRLGEIMLQTGDSAGAMTIVDQVLRKNQYDMQARLLRARILLNNGEVKRSIEDLKEVLKQEPNSRAGLYYMAEAMFRDGQSEQARVYAGDLERFFPDYLPAKLMQVQINLAANDPKSALRIANELIDRLSMTGPDRETSPQLLSELRSRALIARGAAHLVIGNTKAARQDYQTALQQTPNAPEIYVNLAAVSLRENNQKEAEEHYTKALSIEGAHFDALYGLVRLYAAQSRLAEAHTRVDQATALVNTAQPNNKPLNASMRYLKAQIYGFERNSEAAEAELKAAIEIYTDYIAAYSDLANLYVRLQQPERAIAEYQKVLDRKPDSAATHVLLGMLEDGRQNHNVALSHYRKALELDPNSAIAANNTAWLYANNGLGNLDEAVRLAQSAVQRNPDVAGFRDTLGWVYHKKQSHDAAIEQLRKAVSIESENPVFRYHLGVALAAKGDKGGAKRELEQAIRLGDKRGGFGDATEARRMLASL